MGTALLGSSARPISARFCATDLVGSQAWRICELRGDRHQRHDLPSPSPPACVSPSPQRSELQAPTPRRHGGPTAHAWPRAPPVPPPTAASPGDARGGAAAGAAVEPLAVEVVGVFLPPALPLRLRHGGTTLLLPPPPSAGQGRAGRGRAAGHHGKCSPAPAAPPSGCAHCGLQPPACPAAARREPPPPTIDRAALPGYGSRGGSLRGWSPSLPAAAMAAGPPPPLDPSPLPVFTEEGFGDKFMRKTRENPLVPLGEGGEQGVMGGRGRLR